MVINKHNRILTHSTYIALSKLPYSDIFIYNIGTHKQTDFHKKKYIVMVLPPIVVDKVHTVSSRVLMEEHFGWVGERICTGGICSPPTSC